MTLAVEFEEGEATLGRAVVDAVAKENRIGVASRSRGIVGAAAR